MPRKKKLIRKKKKRAELDDIHTWKTKSKNKSGIKKPLHDVKPDKALGVNRLLVSFNKFHIKPIIKKPKETVIMVDSKKTGLTPKERNFLICNCQKRSSRYTRLKDLAAEAEKKHKIFLMFGSYNDAIRKALLDRGWVEKIPPHRMDLSTIRNKKYTNEDDMHKALERLLLSNLVEKCLPNFVWNLKDGWEGEYYMTNNKILHNRVQMEALWTTKQGLCSSVRNNQWYYIEGVSEVVCPRTYDCADDGEREEFEADYKLTACTSLLKWLLSMVANDRPIFVESGTISINVIVFALNRCKEYLFQKQNKDIDKLINSNVTNGQWNGFLKKYYIIMSKQEVFGVDKNNKLPLYLEYAKYMLKEINKYRPQLSCEGCHNIWIMKPRNCSRGRGIRMASKFPVLSHLMKSNKFVFQKYIEEPLLIYQTKFDIRQYYLVTSTYPLVIWMYQDCYLKFSSQKYNLKNYHESIHLTNNAVQRKYKNCNDRHPELPQQNMWSLDTYRKYLKRTDDEKIWDTIIYPGMKKSIIGIMLSCQESTMQWKNRFELYGCDFVLDKNYKPWLIEINSGPDLNPTTKVTAQICPEVLTDMIKGNLRTNRDSGSTCNIKIVIQPVIKKVLTSIKVVIDHAANSKAPTGKFECIYRQDINTQQTMPAVDLAVQGNAIPIDFFHKGKKDDCVIVVDNDIGKEQDVASALEKLKFLHRTGKRTMIDIKRSLQRKICNSQKFSLPSSSDEELKNTVTTITEHLDELIDHITSEESDTTNKVSASNISSPSSSNFRAASTHLVNKKINSATSINSLIVKPVSQFASTEAIKKEFHFSQLDDGPVGKGSCLFHFSQLDDGPIEKGSGLLNPIPFDPVSKENYPNKQEEVANSNIIKANKRRVVLKKQSKSDLEREKRITDENDEKYIGATKKLFSFLVKKHAEYSDSNKDFI